MTTRRTFSVALGGLLLTSFGVHAQKRVRVAFIAFGALEREPFAAFVRALSEFGHAGTEYVGPVAGEGDAMLSQLVERALEQRTDVLVAYGATGAGIVAKATRTVPIVAVVNADPVDSGLVKSLAHPGGNVTGIWMQGPALAQKRVELIKQLVPGIRRLAVVFDPASVGNREMVKYVAEAARHVSIDAQQMEVTGAEDIAHLSTRVKAAKSQALILETSVRLYQQHRLAIIETAAKLRLPAVYIGPNFVRQGGLAAYGVDGSVAMRRAAYFVDRILKGAPAADLPVEQPTKFELALNLKTARALGLTIPHELLVRADEVIQ